MQAAVAPLVGVWVAGVPKVAHNLVISAALSFYVNGVHLTKALAADGSFLVLGFFSSSNRHPEAYECCAVTPRGIPLLPHRLSASLPAAPPLPEPSVASAAIRAVAVVEQPHLMYSLFVSRAPQAMAALPAASLATLKTNPRRLCSSNASPAVPAAKIKPDLMPDSDTGLPKSSTQPQAGELLFAHWPRAAHVDDATGASHADGSTTLPLTQAAPLSHDSVHGGILEHGCDGVPGSTSDKSEEMAVPARTTLLAVGSAEGAQPGTAPQLQATQLGTGGHLSLPAVSKVASEGPNDRQWSASGAKRPASASTVSAARSHSSRGRSCMLAWQRELSHKPPVDEAHQTTAQCHSRECSGDSASLSPCCNRSPEGPPFCAKQAADDKVREDKAIRGNESERPIEQQALRASHSGSEEEGAGSPTRAESGLGGACSKQEGCDRVEQVSAGQLMEQGEETGALGRCPPRTSPSGRVHASTAARGSSLALEKISAAGLSASSWSVAAVLTRAAATPQSSDQNESSMVRACAGGAYANEAPSPSAGCANIVIDALHEKPEGIDPRHTAAATDCKEKSNCEGTGQESGPVFAKGIAEARLVGETFASTPPEATDHASVQQGAVPQWLRSAVLKCPGLQALLHEQAAFVDVADAAEVHTDSESDCANLPGVCHTAAQRSKMTKLVEAGMSLPEPARSPARQCACKSPTGECAASPADAACAKDATLRTAEHGGWHICISSAGATGKHDADDKGAGAARGHRASAATGAAGQYKAGEGTGAASKHRGEKAVGVVKGDIWESDQLKTPPTPQAPIERGSCFGCRSRCDESVASSATAAAMAAHLLAVASAAAAENGLSLSGHDLPNEMPFQGKERSVQSNESKPGVQTAVANLDMAQGQTGALVRVDAGNGLSFEAVNALAPVCEYIVLLQQQVVALRTELGYWRSSSGCGGHCSGDGSHQRSGLCSLRSAWQAGAAQASRASVPEPTAVVAHDADLFGEEDVLQPLSANLDQRLCQQGVKAPLDTLKHPRRELQDGKCQIQDSEAGESNGSVSPAAGRWHAPGEIGFDAGGRFHRSGDPADGSAERLCLTRELAAFVERVSQEGRCASSHSSHGSPPLWLPPAAIRDPCALHAVLTARDEQPWPDTAVAGGFEVGMACKIADGGRWQAANSASLPRKRTGRPIGAEATGAPTNHRTEGAQLAAEDSFVAALHEARAAVNAAEECSDSTANPVSAVISQVTSRREQRLEVRPNSPSAMIPCSLPQHSFPLAKQFLQCHSSCNSAVCADDKVARHKSGIGVDSVEGEAAEREDVQLAARLHGEDSLAVALRIAQTPATVAADCSLSLGSSSSPQRKSATDSHGRKEQRVGGARDDRFSSTGCQVQPTIRFDLGARDGHVPSPPSVQQVPCPQPSEPHTPVLYTAGKRRQTFSPQNTFALALHLAEAHAVLDNPPNVLSPTTGTPSVAQQGSTPEGSSSVSRAAAALLEEARTALAAEDPAVSTRALLDAAEAARNEVVRRSCASRGRVRPPSAALSCSVLSSASSSISRCVPQDMQHATSSPSLCTSGVTHHHRERVLAECAAPTGVSIRNLHRSPTWLHSPASDPPYAAPSGSSFRAVQTQHPHLHISTHVNGGLMSRSLRTHQLASHFSPGSTGLCMEEQIEAARRTAARATAWLEAEPDPEEAAADELQARLEAKYGFDPL
jgi:hypothetical protein